MNAPSVDIKDILEAESSLGLTFITNLFVGKEPATPDNCVTIYDTPGMAPDITLKGKSEDSQNLKRPSIQVRVRNNNYVTGWNLINDIKEVLHLISGETWNGTLYDSILCVIEPAMLNWDSENDRVHFVSTFNIARR